MYHLRSILEKHPWWIGAITGRHRMIKNQIKSNHIETNQIKSNQIKSNVCRMFLDQNIFGKNVFGQYKRWLKWFCQNTSGWTVDISLSYRLFFHLGTAKYYISLRFVELDQYLPTGRYSKHRRLNRSRHKTIFPHRTSKFSANTESSLLKNVQMQDRISATEISGILLN